MAWGNVRKSEAVPFENIVAAQENQKEEEGTTVIALANEEDLPQELLQHLLENEENPSERKKVPAKKKRDPISPESQQFQTPIEPEITELTDADYAYALQLQEEQNVKDNRAFRVKERKREKQELEIYRSRSTKVQIQEEGQTLVAHERRQRTIERELPEEPTKHNHIITSMKASHLFGQFEGMGDIDDAGFLFDQQAIGDLKKKMYKMQRDERKKN